MCHNSLLNNIFGRYDSTLNCLLGSAIADPVTGMPNRLPHPRPNRL
jgi:hypothetical protein